MAATNNKPRAPGKKGSEPKSSAHSSEPVPDNSDLLIVTAHHELSEKEKADLAKVSGKATLEAIVEARGRG